MSPLRSGAFRFSLLMATVFAIGTVALLVVVDRTVYRYATEVADDSVAAEVAILVDEDRDAGRTQAIESVVRRENAVREHDLRYGLIDRSGHLLAGSLPASTAATGWHQIFVKNSNPDRAGTVEAVQLRALGVKLPDGAILVVASDNSDLDELRQRLRGSSVLFGVGIILLALVGGFAIGTVFLRRLGRVNQSVEHIMQGNWTERLPAIGMSLEFDHLSANLNRMLERIEALLEGMRQISTDIAHDLRTPLTRLRHRLETLKDNPDEATETQIDAAIAQTDEILGVFRTLLRISSLEAGSARSRVVEANLSDCLLHLVDIYRPVTDDARHILVSAIEPGIHGRADPEMLVQALTNLIENAIFHTPAGCQIAVTLQRRDDGIVLSVADNGPGIPEAAREHVLKRFYRLDDSRGAPGSGLGLALVAAVASVHGATLRLTDNYPGLRVEFRLPHGENGRAQPYI
ncbi:HAMP domain-containing histidine kinase (plasmid) [Polymorphobacter sp. PAMC 29334]|uniref:sensor histidine kinase n=1 Tax=Polymorphobacter sp. PAMC 29334 TaxID=2862331 RepID=UPI001C685C32|nr:HAMP domain-containing sensor histidine kinase [Polymorphobacter sp. PAMC 29334]QYE33105.1 HAMP domain-containing histidine kinase [Polymorphobacter sp. PAMC 29334]